MGAHLSHWREKNSVPRAQNAKKILKKEKKKIKVAKRRNKNTSLLCFCCLIHARLVLWSWLVRALFACRFWSLCDSILRNKVRSKGRKSRGKSVPFSHFWSWILFSQPLSNGDHGGLKNSHSWKLACNFWFLGFIRMAGFTAASHFQSTCCYSTEIIASDTALQLQAGSDIAFSDLWRCLGEKKNLCFQVSSIEL